MKTFPSSTMFQQIIFKPLTMVKSSPLRADTTEECRWEARLHLQCLGGHACSLQTHCSLLPKAGRTSSVLTAPSLAMPGVLETPQPPPLPPLCFADKQREEGLDPPSIVQGRRAHCAWKTFHVCQVFGSLKCSASTWGPPRETWKFTGDFPAYRRN